MEPTINRAPQPPLQPTPYVFKPYEVKCQETFAWYPGRIIDLVENTDGEEAKRLRVGYDGDWKEPSIVTLDDVRPAPRPRDLNAWEPENLEPTEAQAKAEQTEPFGWWPCVVQTSKDGYYLINFDGWGDVHNEILSKDMLRPRNISKSLKYYSRSIGRRIVKVNTKLRDWAASEPGQLYEYLRKMKTILLCSFDKEKCEVLIIGDKNQLPKAEKLLANTLEHKINLLSLETKMREKDDELKKEKEKFSGAVVEEFEIPDDMLIKYVFGKRGANIRKAKRILGIIQIKVDDSKKPTRCTIYAKAGCEDAAQMARDTLEIFMKCMPVPEDCMGSIIGTRGASIKKIEDDSGVMYIRGWSKFCEQNDRDEVDLPKDDPEDHELLADIGQARKKYLVIIGTASAVEFAKCMIRQKITFKRQQQSFYRHKIEIERRLNDIRGREFTRGQSNQFGDSGDRGGPRSNSRGRGRSRGAGRGGRGRGGRNSNNPSNRGSGGGGGNPSNRGSGGGGNNSSMSNRGGGNSGRGRSNSNRPRE